MKGSARRASWYGNRPAVAGTRVGRVTCGIALALLGAGALSAQDSESAPVPPSEDSDVAVLSSAGAHRAFVTSAFGGGGAAVIEAGDDALPTVGTIPMARNGVLAITRDASKAFVAETYWSRGNRGDRVDLLSVYDGLTLNLEKEITLPGRLHVVPKVPAVSLSDDDKLAYVYDMLPSSNVHVVDIAAGRVVQSVDVPGCAFAYPYGPRSFATICGDGTISAITLNAQGEANAVSTPRLFDPDMDPVRENSIVDRTTGEGWFLSYTGMVYPVAFKGGPVPGQPWSITEAAGMPRAGTGVQELAWRPGGGQFAALHRSTKRLYVLMHPGTHWTHKEPGTEIWVLDTIGRTLIRRIRLEGPAANIAVTQDESPLLYVFGEETPGMMTVLDGQTGRTLRARPMGAGITLVPGL